jgi:ubiquinone/menaquinone biosynthesis C-methylase UbiE
MDPSDLCLTQWAGIKQRESRHPPFPQVFSLTTSDDIGAGYDALAESYARELFDELTRKPLDRALLASFVEQVKGAHPDGSILEVGCGPGHVGRHVHDLGAHVVGTDVSRAMLAVARRRSPMIDFHHGDMLALNEPDGAYAGVLSFYAIVHLEPGQLVTAFREMRRVLRPNGLSLVAFHVGDERLRPGELWGTKVELEWVFFPPVIVEDALREAGLAIEARAEREPYLGAEHPSRRAYLFARKPA